MIKIEVPATTTNFGSGFDTFGLALSLTNTFSVDFSDKYEVQIEGYSSGIPKDQKNLFIKVYKKTCQSIGKKPKPLKLIQENRVPPARGLGSSATAIVGGIEAALALHKVELPLKEKLKIAFEFEKHPDNIIPAFVGGFTVCATSESGVIFKKLPFPEDIKIVFVIPDFEVSTSEARRVLPKKVELKEAVFNVQRSALFVSALLTKDYKLLREAVRDKLHQPYREKLVPGLSEAILVSYKEGALATFLSGAGPTICSLTTENEEKIGEAIREVITKFSGYDAQVMVLKARNEGVKVYS
ncbi:homoserine kinase [Aquifex aeolicus]|uniref:Homoserine kinase n=1 Tax=Aquifex aeolicus (strain VF5) TaxID=224324 RepID=KHSE_AQUAE|nr:homoserine kinase [Aquifex aeolicus]O67332.1 RecName: Full=Homoserine kinase; Short=HK; Short=HSK [Aquifex aeolicus VF5]AAC07283.1 homoserine kinase [Aquifex aeolicus VF5]